MHFFELQLSTWLYLWKENVMCQVDKLKKYFWKLTFTSSMHITVHLFQMEMNLYYFLHRNFFIMHITVATSTTDTHNHYISVTNPPFPTYPCFSMPIPTSPPRFYLHTLYTNVHKLVKDLVPRFQLVTSNP